MGFLLYLMCVEGDCFSSAKARGSFKCRCFASGKEVEERMCLYYDRGFVEYLMPLLHGSFSLNKIRQRAQNRVHSLGLDCVGICWEG